MSRFSIDSERLKTLWQQNLSPLEIATRMRCTASGVLQAVKRLGLDRAPGGGAVAITQSSSTGLAKAGDTNCG